MDKQTINTYNLEAERIAQLHSNLKPSRLYTLITKYFTKAAQKWNASVKTDTVLNKGSRIVFKTLKQCVW